MTDQTNPTPQYADLCERLRRAAISASDIQRQMAQAKSLRQGHEPPRDDLYMWATPEQTLEGQAATALQSLQAENERLRENLSRVGKFVEDYFAPWGSWKTAWWEGEVSDDAAFSDNNALKHVANIARAALAADNAGGGE